MRGFNRIVLSCFLAVHCNIGGSHQAAADVLTAHTKQRASTVRIPGGRFSPLYGMAKGITEVEVRPFELEVVPVSNGEFYKFVRAHKMWQRGRVPVLLSDVAYLSHWHNVGKAGEWAPAASERSYPVVFVSWFAAHAFCEARGGRLPTVNEWEFAGAASETKANASRDPEFVEKLLAWYSTPQGKSAFHDVGKGQANYWGLRNMHGLVWEWNEDFNSVFVTGDNREDSDDLKNLFCGGSATGAADKSDYAAFMRYALRNSLRANYSLKNVGFRCAYDVH
ncbi:MAG: formylglycine-generating enzyme family protein [Oligoflexia bacterium]|nr:formylglycine-generating enzyme family protein [Oligoflexia bacterium]